MPSSHNCPSCQAVLHKGAPLPAGKPLKCPSCGTSYTVPADPAAAAKVGAAAAAKPAAGANRPAAPPAPPSEAVKRPAATLQGTAGKPAAAPAAGPTPKAPPKPPHSANGGPATPAKADAGKPSHVKRPAATMQGTESIPASAVAPPAAPPAVELDKDTRHEIHFGKMTHDGQMPLPAAAPPSAAPPADKRRIPCPNCRQRLKVPAALAPGKTVKCPKCGQSVKVPPPEHAPSPPAAAAGAPTAGAPAAPPESPPPAAEAEAAIDAEVTAEPGAAPAPAAPAGPSAAFSIDNIASTPLKPEAPTAGMVAYEVDAEVKKARKRALRRKQLIAGGIVIAILGAVGGAVALIKPSPRGDGTVRPTAPPAEQPIAEADWKPFTPPNGHCQVLMPGLPELVPPVEAPKEGAPVATQYTLQRKDKDAIFTICFINLPPLLVDKKSFENLYGVRREDSIRASYGRLRTEMDLAVNGHPGREFQLDVPGGWFIVERLFFVQSPTYVRLYIMQANVGGRYGDVEAAKFLNSLKLPPRMMPPPPPAKDGKDAKGAKAP